MSSSPEFTDSVTATFASLQYRDIAGPSRSGRALDLELRDTSDHRNHPRRKSEVEMTEAEFAARVATERAEAAAQAEQKMRQELEQKVQAARAPIAETLRQFAAERDEYFARVEAEVVQLSLSIAAKILHREAQVDPMLVASLVRMAVERMAEGSSVQVRVAPVNLTVWKQYFAAQPHLSHVQVAADAELSNHDCVLDTELGSANFGLDSQLKEVEKGFFDLLALRPVTR
jgi:flagellar assembly protein FliH